MLDIRRNSVRTHSNLSMLCVVTLLALGASACTSSTSAPTPDKPTRSDSSTLARGGRIGVLNVAESPDSIDSGDPAYGTWSETAESHVGLLTTTPRINGKAGSVVAALAQAVPVPTDGGRQYVFQLRPHLKYSDGSPVRASDFRYAIQRLYVASSGFAGKFSVLEGASEFSRTKKGSISGIIPDDSAATVTFKLTGPDPTFTELLAGYESAPVPSRTPSTDTPLTPATGPMMVTAFRTSERYVLKKNPNYQPTSALPASNVDEVIGTGVANAAVALNQTLDGQYDLDANPIGVPADQLGKVLKSNSAQTKTVVLEQTNMFSLNQSNKVLKDVRVRQAVNYAIDRTAMAKLAGGLLVPTENVLPPGENSYVKVAPYTYDLAKAKSLIQEAGARGASVTIDAAGEDDAEPFAVYLSNQLKLIGLNATIKVIPSQTYFGIPSVPATDPAIAWYPWNEVIPDASDWIGQLFDGRLINNSHNNNWGMVNEPDINRAIDAASSLSLGQARNSAWAALDRAAVEKALVVPYGNPVQVAVFSKRINPACYQQFQAEANLMSNLCLK